MTANAQHIHVHLRSPSLSLTVCWNSLGVLLGQRVNKLWCTVSCQTLSQKCKVGHPREWVRSDTGPAELQQPTSLVTHQLLAESREP
eukprot:5439307-Amphidinium_carterae.1